MTALNPDRGEAVERYGVLAEDAGVGLQALAELAAQVCEVPKAEISLNTADRPHLATVGFEPSTQDGVVSLSAAVADEADLVVVHDVRRDRRFQPNGSVNGDPIAVRFFASAPLRARDGAVVGRLSVFDERSHDLAEDRKRALLLLADRVVDALELQVRTRELQVSDDQLDRTRDELDRANRRLGNFAAHLTHDLRTPLTAILLNTEVLAGEPVVAEDDFASTHLQAVLDAGRRMNRIIEEILNFVQVNATLRMGAVDLGAVADAVMLDLGPLLRDGAEVTRSDLPTVAGDEQQLYSVMVNLISNALKYTRPGVPAAVHVSAERREEAWRVLVTDNGVGVPETGLADLFEPFARGNTDVPGAGVGLASAKVIVEMHGGRIGLAPAEPGPGATAWFEIPD